jgi:hypothetical protein
MLSFPVYREPNRRQTASPLPSTLHSAHLPHRGEKLLNATPAESSPYKCPLPQPLSFDILTNARGVWGTLQRSNVLTFNSSSPWFPVHGSLFALFTQRVFHNSIAFKQFRTLSQKRGVYGGHNMKFLKSYLKSVLADLKGVGLLLPLFVPRLITVNCGLSTLPPPPVLSCERNAKRTTYD